MLIDPIPDVILVRGAPGAGKSQTAKALARWFPGGSKVEVDMVRNMAISVNWTKQSEHIQMLHISSMIVSEFIKLQIKPVIVIDTFSGNKLDAFLDDMRAIKKVEAISIIGLYVSEDELDRRLKARKDGEFKNKDICFTINKELQLSPRTGEIQIETTGRTPEETALEIVSGLQKKSSTRVLGQPPGTENN